MWIDEAVQASPGRDWHATYLTDPRAMDAARARAVRHGEDGWSAAYTVALTLPAAPGSHAATGARDVLVPDTLPDAAELTRLADATPTDPDVTGTIGGYYDEPNIDYDNRDMAPSMTRRARPDEVIRPDLRCPACCASAGDPEETGMPEQVYRCTECHELWEYVPGVDGGGYPQGCGQCWACSLYASTPPEQRAALLANYGPHPQPPRPQVITVRPDGVFIEDVPESPTLRWLRLLTPDAAVEPSWHWAPDPAGTNPDQPPPPGSMRMYVDEMAALFGPLRDTALAAVNQVAGLGDLEFVYDPPETEDETAQREATERYELALLLNEVHRGRVTADHLDDFPSAPEARRRQLLITGGAERGHDRRHERRVHLTALGRIAHRELRRNH
jgi:hypothetical protein